jgi:hypothetical protein
MECTPRQLCGSCWRTRMARAASSERGVSCRGLVGCMKGEGMIRGRPQETAEFYRMIDPLIHGWVAPLLCPLCVVRAYQVKRLCV